MEEETYKTLRDEIAIEAMKVMMSMNLYDPAKTAKKAYQWADAMLKARESNSTESPTRT